MFSGNEKMHFVLSASGRFAELHSKNLLMLFFVVLPKSFVQVPSADRLLLKVSPEATDAHRKSLAALLAGRCLWMGAG